MLWNVREPAMQVVGYKQSDVASLLAQRNALAASLAGKVPRPPPVIANDRACGNCFCAAKCATYHKARACVNRLFYACVQVDCTIWQPVFCSR